MSKKGIAYIAFMRAGQLIIQDPRGGYYDSIPVGGKVISGPVVSGTYVTLTMQTANGTIFQYVYEIGKGLVQTYHVG